MRSRVKGKFYPSWWTNSDRRITTRVRFEETRQQIKDCLIGEGSFISGRTGWHGKITFSPSLDKYMHTHNAWQTQTDGQTDGRAGGQTDRQTGRQTHRQTHRHTDRHTHINKDNTDTERQTRKLRDTHCKGTDDNYKSTEKIPIIAGNRAMFFMLVP